MNKQEQQKFVKDFKERQIKGMENLTQTKEIEQSIQDKKIELENLEEATNKFFNNDR